MPNVGSRAEKETRNQTILRLHETGVPKTVISRQLGVSLAVIGTVLARNRPQEAQEAMSGDTRILENGRLRWNVERRTQLGAAIFERVESLLPGIESARELKDLSIAFAVMTDKMRLESDQSTQNVAISTNDHLTDAERAAIRDVLEGR